MSSAGPSSHSSPAFPSPTAGKLPKLPRVQSERVRKRIFTHSSMAEGRRYSFQAPANDPSADNEELGHIGDQVFALVVTDLIQTNYPHLRVGPASKIRDYVKCNRVIAEISVSYELHKKLNLPDRQASGLRDSQNVRVNVFKAYVGGVYRDRGLEIATKWLISLFQSHVDAAYQRVRKEYLLPPTTPAVPQPGTPTARTPSPPASASSDGARLDMPRHFSEGPGDTSRRMRMPPQANVPQQRSGKAGAGVGARPTASDKPSNKRQRRPIDGEGGGDAGGSTSRRRLSTASDTRESARKRQRSGEASDA